MEYIDDKYKIKTAKGVEKHITKITAVEVMCIKMADVVRVIWAVDNKLHHYDISGSVIYIIKEDALQLAVDTVMNSYTNHLKKEPAKAAALANYKELYEGEPLTWEVPVDAFIKGVEWKENQNKLVD